MLASFAHAFSERTVWDEKTSQTSSEEYINHCERVADFLVEFGVTSHEVICAALLHDTVEDEPGAVVGHYHGTSTRDLEADQKEALDKIAENFSQRVADIVASVTNPVFDDGLSDKEHLVAYTEHIASIESPEGKLVKIADFLDNAGNLSRVPPEKRAWLISKYQPLIPVYDNFLHDSRLGALLSESGFLMLRLHFKKVSDNLLAMR